jgi:hypothetical protein
MSGEAKSNGKDSGGAVVEIRVPMLTITFDPRTCQVSMSGYVPTHEFAKMLLLAAADEEERIIRKERDAARIARVSSDFMSSIKGTQT